MDHRLSRRGLLTGSAAALVAAALGGCTDVSSAGTATPAPSRPPAGTPLASWELVGGFTRAGLLALRPPRLVVLGDGEVIADAIYQSRLRTDELDDLALDLLDALRTPDVQRRRRALGVADAPTTRMTVWGGSGPVTVSAEGLDDVRDLDVYADELYTARDRLAAVHKTVTTTAQPYLADRVRVVTEEIAEEPADTRAWPGEVTMPATGADRVARADLTGDRARAAVRLLTRDLDQRGAWPAYRTGDGRIVQASWRYLLPCE